MSGSFYVKFWGVRGTIPTPHASKLGYGGNTSCVEVRCGNIIFALDAGTGIIGLGEQEDISHLHLLLSHTHLDHILGLCCMRRIFDEEFSADIWAGHLLPDMFINEALIRLMSPPIFPVPLHTLTSQLAFHDFSAGQTLRHADFRRHEITVETLPLNHPDRATGYRINYKDKSVCYITDIEHLKDGLDEALVEFVKGTDVFIYDCTYDDRNFEPYIGWGHSTWQQGMRLAEAAGVGQLVMFHHDPSATDTDLDARAQDAEKNFSQDAVIAKEGMVLTLVD